MLFYIHEVEWQGDSGVDGWIDRKIDRYLHEVERGGDSGVCVDVVHRQEGQEDQQNERRHHTSNDRSVLWRLLLAWSARLQI